MHQNGCKIHLLGGRPNRIACALSISSYKLMRNLCYIHIFMYVFNHNDYWALFIALSVVTQLQVTQIGKSLSIMEITH